MGDAKSGSDQKQPPTMLSQNPWFLFVPGPRLEELRLFHEHGVVAALYDALVLCRQAGLPFPDWVLDGAEKVLAERLQAGKSDAIGAKGNEKQDFAKIWLISTDGRLCGLRWKQAART